MPMPEPVEPFPDGSVPCVFLERTPHFLSLCPLFIRPSKSVYALWNYISLKQRFVRHTPASNWLIALLLPSAIGLRC
jgi:hypothetical protein